MGSITGKLADGTLIIKTPAKLPKVLDLLIVGGGPAGTAAAFHAKELGLSALVIDFDDILRRIRDYPKEKPIKPSYGGGDKMKFPQGGELIQKLHFDPIDKDEMHQSWKKFYREYSVPTQIGVEMIGMKRRSDGIMEIYTKNHNNNTEPVYLTRHLVMAIGRGFPRRFDIPGNLDGIVYRLKDPQMYIGSPVCIVGGGTSAAEAAIAISNAKAQVEDESAVYWSYRGAKMPRISAALADEFFNSYIGNGNIRYLPKSEPIAIVTGRDRQDYLSLRVDHREIAGRPNETLNLEFPKDRMIACIGEDLPEKFLKNIGVEMVTGGPKNRKRMAVTPLLESRVPNVYLIGDLLSQAYLATEDFDADPAGFKEVRHLGIIKSALIDGVVVTEAIAQKLQGKSDIAVELAFSETPPKPEQRKENTRFIMPPIAEPDETADRVLDSAQLVRILPSGLEGDTYPLQKDGVTTIGRQDADIAFPEDTALVENHASILHQGEKYQLRDDASNGRVFLLARGGKMIEAEAGNMARVGAQYLVFGKSGGQFTMAHYNKARELVNTYKLSEKTLVAGRDAPDITLDAGDLTLSRRHVSVTAKDGKLFIRDLHSKNKTYLRVKNPVEIEDGDMFRVGNQLFRLSLGKEVNFAGIETPNHTILISNTTAAGKRLQAAGLLPPTPVAPAPKAPKAPAAPPPPPAAPKPAAAGELTVTFKNNGKTCAFKKGDCILDIAKKNGVPINAECRLGSCGSDPIRILKGQEFLNEIGDDEELTLEMKDMEPGEYRMACMAKATGPIVVEVVEE